MVMTNALNPRILQPGDIDPNWRWDKHIPSLGHMAVDFERRVIMTAYADIDYLDQKMH